MVRRRSTNSTYIPTEDNRREDRSSTLRIAIWGAILAIGIAIGAALSTLNPSPQTVDAIRLDNIAPSRDFCNNYGASALVTNTRTYVTLNPFNVYVSQSEVQPGCVVLPNNWNELLRQGAIRDADIRACKDRMNTFGYTGDLTSQPQVDCVYQTEDRERLLVPAPAAPNPPA